MKILKNILAVILGIVIGSLVNMLIIIVSYGFVTYPEGVVPMGMGDFFDPVAMQTTFDSIKANIDKFGFSHYIMPFLAHALGTMAGAFIAAKVAATKKMVFAYVIGAWFLLGGIVNALDLGMGFVAMGIDILLAYIPFAYLGGKIATRK